MTAATRRLPLPALADLQAYVDANAALREALGVPGGCRLLLEPFAQGEYNVNYAFDAPALDGNGVSRPFLLRVNLGSQMHLEQQICYEAAALRLLEPSGRVPRVCYVDGSCRALPYGVCVEERLPGRPLRYQSDLPRAASILADVHAVPVGPEAQDALLAPADPLGAIVEECAAMYECYRAWPQAQERVICQVDELFDLVATATQRARGCRQIPRCIVNTELNAGNFLINDALGARSYLVDWEKPVLGEPAQDLAHFLAPTTTFWKTDVLLDRAQMERFLDLYEGALAGRLDVAGLRGRLDAYLAATCLRGVAWCTMAYVQYVEDGRAGANPRVYSKISSYLQPGFLWYLATQWCEGDGGRSCSSLGCGMYGKLDSVVQYTTRANNERSQL